MLYHAWPKFLLANSRSIKLTNAVTERVRILLFTLPLLLSIRHCQSGFKRNFYKYLASSRTNSYVLPSTNLVNIAIEMLILENALTNTKIKLQFITTLSLVQ